jgi:phosphate/sulfate permease
MNKLLIILAVVAVLVGLGLWLGGGNVKRDVNGENMIGEVVKPTEAIILG